MTKSILKALLLAATFVGASSAFAKAPLQLDSSIFVEREQTKADGSKAVTLAKPTKVIPGDSLVFVVEYKNVGDKPAADFVVTNPMPRAVRFAGSADGLEVVSVDGGKSWGFLSTLKVAKPDGTQRAATFADVTHVKWNLKQTLAPGQGGKLVFRGVVK